MGGAVYIALDGEANFAALPERVEAALRGTLTGNERVAHGHAQDRQASAPPARRNAARQVIRISTTSRAGDREVVRVRPFVRVASNLSLTTSELSASVPKFNPARLLMDNGRGNAVAADESPGAEPDAEVSFVTRDLASVLPRVEDRGRRPARGRHRARARCRRMDRQPAAGRSPRASDPTRPAAPQHGLCGRGATATPMRVRGAHRSGKHHAAAEERRQGQRPERLERAPRRGEEGRVGQHDPARPRRLAGRHPRAHRGARRCADATAACAKDRSCASCSRRTAGACASCA